MCDCTIYYLISGALVAVLCLPAIAFWYLKRSKAEDAKQNSCPAQEMIPVSDRTQDENLVYREVLFNNHNKKPKERRPEDTTYAEIKTTLPQDDGLIYTKVKYNAKSKANNLPQNIDPETTYAEVKPMSAKSEPRDGSNDMYATVNKNRPA